MRKKILILLGFSIIIQGALLAQGDVNNIELKSTSNKEFKNWKRYTHEPGFTIEKINGLNIKKNTAEFVALNFMKAILVKKGNYKKFISTTLKSKFRKKLLANIKKGIEMKSFHLKARVNKNLIDKAAIFKGKHKMMVKEFGEIDCIIFAENSKQADFFFLLRKEGQFWKLALVVGNGLLRI